MISDTQGNEQTEFLLEECIEKIYSYDELKAFFKEKNINFTDAQLENIVKEFVQIYKNPKELEKLKNLTNSELENIVNRFAQIYKNPKELEKLKNITDDDLENIAGGRFDITIREVWAIAALLCILGFGTAAIVDNIKQKVAKKTKPTQLHNRYRSIAQTHRKATDSQSKLKN